MAVTACRPRAEGGAINRQPESRQGMSRPTLSDATVLRSGPALSGIRIRGREHQSLVPRSSDVLQALDHPLATGRAICEGPKRIVSGTPAVLLG